MPFIWIFLALLLAAPGDAKSDDPGSSAKDHYQEGIAHMQAGEYDDAIESFQHIIESNPSAPVYNLLGLTYMKQNKSIESAIGSFKQAIRTDPKYAEAYFNLATTYATQGHDSKLAAEYFQKTVDIDPNYTKAYFGLGWFSLTEKYDAGTALEYFEKTIKANPDFAEAHYGQGLSYIQLGKSHMALAAISMLHSLRRDDLASTLEKIINKETTSAKPEEKGNKSDQNQASFPEGLAGS